MGGATPIRQRIDLRRTGTTLAHRHEDVDPRIL
jgi:hypothetical protein